MKNETGRLHYFLCCLFTQLKRRIVSLSCGRIRNFLGSSEVRGSFLHYSKVGIKRILMLLFHFWIIIKCSNDIHTNIMEGLWLHFRRAISTTSLHEQLIDYFVGEFMGKKQVECMFPDCIPLVTMYKIENQQSEVDEDNQTVKAGQRHYRRGRNSDRKLKNSFLNWFLKKIE